MRELTTEEIAKLASKRGVRKIAVENFLSTMGDDERIARANAWYDFTLYKWNSATINTIFEGIQLALKEKQRSGT